MIEAEHSVVIATDIDSVWNYVQDISRWALLFPGCKECEVIDDHHSKWIIKVGAGGLVKTVNVLVHVEEWSGPERVNFSYRLESEPVLGSGCYTAKRQGNNATEITLHVKVEGSGQMAPMWEAMSRPLLPQMAKSFSNKLRDEIERSNGVSISQIKAQAITQQKRAGFANFLSYLQQIWKGVLSAFRKNRNKDRSL